MERGAKFQCKPFEGDGGGQNFSAQRFEENTIKNVNNK